MHYIILITLMQVQSKAEQRIYDMIDVLREGNMRWSALFISHLFHSRGWIWPVLDEEILFLTACGHSNFGEILLRVWLYLDLLLPILLRFLARPDSSKLAVSVWNLITAGRSCWWMLGIQRPCHHLFLPMSLQDINTS